MGWVLCKICNIEYVFTESGNGYNAYISKKIFQPGKKDVIYMNWYFNYKLEIKQCEVVFSNYLQKGFDLPLNTPYSIDLQKIQKIMVFM